MNRSDLGGSNGDGLEVRAENPIVLIPFGGEFLAMTPEKLAKALSIGRLVTGNTPPHPGTAAQSQEKLVDADGMSRLTGVPASWFLEQARQDKIPHLRVGKYVRFRPADVLPTLESARDHKSRRVAIVQKIPAG